MRRTALVLLALLLPAVASAEMRLPSGFTAAVYVTGRGEAQDGRAVTADVDRFVYSTAVEADTPEMRAARALGIERVPRPALLAEIVNAGRPGVAPSAR